MPRKRPDFPRLGIPDDVAVAHDHPLPVCGDADAGQRTACRQLGLQLLQHALPQLRVNDFANADHANLAFCFARANYRKSLDN